MTNAVAGALLSLTLFAACSASTTVLERPDAPADADAGSLLDATADAPQDASVDDGGAPDSSAALSNLPSLCESSDFCWVNPRPFGYHLDQLAGASADDVWALSTAAPAQALLRFDGERWDFAGPPLEYAATLRSIAVDDEGTLWATGTGPNGRTLLSFDGYWRRHAAPSGTCRQLVSASGLGLFCIVNGHIEGFVGEVWERVFTGTGVGVGGLWPAPDGDLWAVGSAGTALRYDGHRWLRTATDIRADLRWVFGTSNEDVWALSRGGGPLLHFDGSAWRTVLSSTPTTRYPRVSVGVAVAADDAWLFVGADTMHWDGALWTSRAADGPTVRDGLAIDGALFVAGERGLLTRLDSEHPRLVGDIVESGDIEMAFAVGGEIFLAGYAGLLRWDGTSLTRLSEGAIRSVWGTSANDLYLVGGDGKLWHWDGTSRDEVELELESPSGVRAVWNPALHVCGTGPDNVWVVGKLVWHFDGTGWTVLDAPTLWIRSAVTSGSDDLWVVGEGELHHFDGDAWTRHDPGDALEGSPYALWQEPSGRLWVVSHRGSVAFFEAGLWHATGVDPSWGRLEGGPMPIAGLPGGGVIIAGGLSMLLFDGESWRTIDPGIAVTDPKIHGVAVNAAGDVLIGGKSGMVMLAEGGAR